MKKSALVFSALVFVLFLAVFAAGCAQQEDVPLPDQADEKGSVPLTNLGYEKGPARKVIIDTDSGADDASALIFAAKSENLDILGVTVLAGNVGLEQASKNALMALQIAGSDAPVYEGEPVNFLEEEIEAYSVYGEDGMGDAGLVDPLGKAEDGDAVEFILESARKYPDELEIISLGPATNIAKAIEKDRDAMKKIKKIWSMGTAGLGVGNATPVAEFNVYADPEAYKVMLDSGINITIVGLDMCRGEAEWTNAQFRQLEKENDIGKFVSRSFTKLREFYEANGSPESVTNCDGLAMACAIYPDFVKKTIKCHGSCMTDRGETRAQVIFYQKGFIYDGMLSDELDYNVELAAEVDKPAFFDLYLEAIQ